MNSTKMTPARNAAKDLEQVRMPICYNICDGRPEEHPFMHLKAQQKAHFGCHAAKIFKK
jgi:hypothetical protein